MSLILLAAVGISAAALTPLALPLARIVTGAVLLRSAAEAGAPTSEVPADADVERSVRDRLYGSPRDVEATPIARAREPRTTTKGATMAFPTRRAGAETARRRAARLLEDAS